MPIAKKLSLIALSGALLLSSFSATTMADDMTKSIEQALKFGQEDGKYGKINFDLRFRYTNADGKSPNKKTGNAFVGRIRIGYLTPVFAGLQGYAEYVQSHDIAVNDYNSTRNGKTQYEIVSDPRGKELSQLWLSYKGIADTEFKVGRQRVQFDNERMIGIAAWRQLERVFDGLLIANTSLANTTIKVGYLVKQQNTDATIHSMQLPVANIAYHFADWGTLSSYGYFFDDHDLRPQDSNQTYGVRFDGSRKINNDFSLLYTAEYAHQTDYGSNPTAYQVDYYHLIAGLKVFNVTARAGMEQLDGKGLNKTFDTPLGSVHKFNGWADVLTTTPDNGLRDVYGMLEAEWSGIKFTGSYHNFSDDASKQHFANEWDFLLSKEFDKHYTLWAKYAYVSADSQGVRIVGGSTPIDLYDTQKIWFGAELSF
jgi:hypothetical protein